MARENPDYNTPSLVRFACEEEDINDDATQATVKKSNLRRNRRNNDCSDKFRSDIRSKFHLEAVWAELLALQQENEMLRMIIRERISPLEVAEDILKKAEAPPVDIYLKSSVLMDDENQCLKEDPNEKKSMRNNWKVSRHTLERRNSFPNLVSEPETLAAKDNIPRVLTVPKMKESFSARSARKMKCREHRDEKKIDETTDFHFGSSGSLAAALSGNYAF